MARTLVLGLDEAGYGPRLGPLVVAAFALEAPGPPDGVAELLRAGAATAGERDDGRVLVADSKRVHRAGQGLAPLERHALALLAAMDGAPPATLGALEARLGVARASDAPAWAADPATPLPRAADRDDVLRRGLRLAAAARASGVRLRHAGARVVCEPEFNRRVAATGNKATALFGVAAPLFGAVFALDADGPVRRAAFLDKQGGRDRYLPLFGDAFRDLQVLARGPEGRAGSRYVFARAGRSCDVAIEPRGERHWPVAAASMLAKYLRELYMEALNAFWQRAVPGLAPTAGYPGDARRFLGAIETARSRLAIPPEAVARCR